MNTLPAIAVVNTYLTAFYTGDFEVARSVVADDFQFEGPFLRCQGSANFFAGAEGLKPIVRGHHTHHQWGDGDEVCTAYNVELSTPLRSGAITMYEWHTIRSGRLAAGRVVFDSAAFRSLTAPAQV